VIPNNTVTISDLFTNFLNIPDFQRDYVWEESHVEQLLRDVLEFTNDPAVEKEHQYFIGSIVLREIANSTYEIIDGQQRITSIYLTLCAIKQGIRAIEKSADVSNIERKLFDVADDTTGRPQARARLTLPNEEAQSVLDALMRDPNEIDDTDLDRGTSKLVAAYAAAAEFLQQEFKDAKSLFSFYKVLSQSVSVLPFTAKSEMQAIRVFEVLNYRGKQITPVDLIKSLLFKSLSVTDWEKLKDKWGLFTDELSKASERPSRFFTYFILGEYKEFQKESGIYKWILEHDKETKYNTQPLRFVKELQQGAIAYRHFLEGKNPDGTINPGLSNISLFARSARQHLMMMMSARHLSNKALNELGVYCETAFFVAMILQEHSRINEDRFKKWSPLIKECRSDADVRKAIDGHIIRDLRGVTKQVCQALAQITEKEITRSKLLYVLAKIAAHVEQTAAGNDPRGFQVSQLMASENLDIEHILSRNASSNALSEFGPIGDGEIVSKLGNLTLLRRGDNRSIKNKAYSEKKRIYKNAHLILTRSLVDMSPHRGNNATDRAFRLLKPYVTWNSKAVEDRQQLLALMAPAVWALA